uniref:Zinc finger, AN1-type domain 1 n=1 Tax=Eptatretus burgeri TaxID=7764 RepID=A0A8C4QHY0_EPTBU
MSELDVGRQCSLSSCKQLDFLPFTCDYCGHVFCLAHRKKDDHGCAESEKNLHVSSAELPKELYSCSVKSCCQKVAICITCTHCQQQLCLRHRHHSDHDCVHLHQALGRSTPRGGVVVPDGRVKKSSIIQVKDTKSGRRGAQNPQVAAKVALMRVKQQAVGSKSIPQEERFYLNVHVALDGRNDQLPAFVSKYWTVGKVLDSVITAAKVHSDNHLLGAQFA